MSSNALSWSPTFPTTVLLASEDHNLYTFDIRHLAAPSQIYKGHVAAVMSCDWAPTGLEFVSGGWDRTVRIWKEGRGHSPEVYHTKRMQRYVTSSAHSLVGHSVCTHPAYRPRSSPPTRASCSRGQTTGTCAYGRGRRRSVWGWSPRASGLRSSTATASRTDGRWTRRSGASCGASSPFLPGLFLTYVSGRSRHIPRPVYQASKLKRTMLEAQRVKEERRRKHTRAGAEKPKAERKKLVVVEQT